VFYIDIFSEHGGSLTIQSPWGTKSVYVNDGGLSFKPNEVQQITLKTVRGKNYRLAVK